GGLSVVAAAIVGIVPALNATRRDVKRGMTNIGAGGSGMKLGKTWTLLIVAQVGFAVALLPMAVLGAWQSIQSGLAEPGFAADEFLSAELGMYDVTATGAGAAGTVEFTRRYADRQTEVMRRLQAEPGISGVTYA